MASSVVEFGKRHAKVRGGDLVDAVLERARYGCAGAGVCAVSVYEVPDRTVETVEEADVRGSNVEPAVGLGGWPGGHVEASILSSRARAGRCRVASGSRSSRRLLSVVQPTLRFRINAHLLRETNLKWGVWVSSEGFACDSDDAPSLAAPAIDMPLTADRGAVVEAG